MSTTHRTLTYHVVTITAAVLASTPQLHADVVQGWWISETDFGYELTHMPDFDQRRMVSPPDVDGLPNNGSFYCVPTAMTNIFAYIAGHGFPEVAPGPSAWGWQSQLMYNEATSAISDLGDLMGTTPMGGTGSQGWHDGAVSWMAPYDDFAVYTYWAHDDWSPTLSDLTISAVQGKLVSYAYGRYSETASPGSGYPTLIRNNGHAVTLTGTFRNGVFQQVSHRDPADDSTNSTQSAFGNRYFEVSDGLFGFDGGTRTVSEIITDADDDLRRIIDQTVSIRIRDGLSYAPGQDHVRLIQPAALLGADPTDIQIQLPDGLSIVAALNDPGTGLIIMAVNNANGPSTISSLNPVSGQLTTIRTFVGPVAMAQGRKRELYVTTGGVISCLNLELEGFIEAEASFPGTAMAYDDAGDRLVLINTSARQLYQIGEGLNGPVVVTFIPTNVALGTAPRMAVGPDSRVWTVSPGFDTITGIYREMGQPADFIQINLPGVQNPTSISADEKGDLYVTCDAGVCQVHHDGNNWAVVSGLFDTVTPEQILDVARSRTNFDPAQHLGPGWDNVDPDLLVRGDFEADCPGDVNFDGTVDVVDLLALLSGWGESYGGPDTNGDGLVDVIDLLLLLSNWGAAC